MCAKTVSFNKFDPQPFTISPSEFRILQVRDQVGGRKGQGFFNIPEEGKNISELWDSDDSEERAVAEVLKDRLLEVMRSYIEVGIINKEEI